MTPRGPAWEALGTEDCFGDELEWAAEGYEAGVADERARGEEAAVLDVVDAYASGYNAGEAIARAEERARGMRRAARYATNAHLWASLFWRSDGAHLTRERHARAAMRAQRIVDGEPAFTTPRAFGREP